MVQASTFSGKPHEDVNTHLQNFLEVCSTIAIKESQREPSAVAYYHSLCFEKQSNGSTLSRTHGACATTFINKFFPMSKTSALRARISSFRQKAEETIPEAWERL